MKLLAAALVVGLLSIPVGGARARASDRALAGLVGPVSAVATYVAPVVAGDGALSAGPKQLTQQERYDQRGEVLAVTRFSNGDPVERVAYRHTTDGMLVRDARVRTGSTVFALVSTGAERRSGPGPEWRIERAVTRYSFDSRGFRVDASTFDGDACCVEPTAREAYSYDDDGRPAEVRRYSGAGELLETTAFTYTPCGMVARLDVVRPDGTLDRRVLFDDYLKDRHGNWTARSEVETSADGVVLARRETTREIEYFGTHARPARRATRPNDVTASATRPRRVHPLVSTDASAETGVPSPLECFARVSSVLSASCAARIRSCVSLARRSASSADTSPASARRCA
jgi:hypothetical protein